MKTIGFIGLGKLGLPIAETIAKKLVLVGSNACFLGEMNYLSNGFSLHLLHDPATVNFYCLKGSFPLSGNLLTQHPLGYKSKNL